MPRVRQPDPIVIGNIDNNREYNFNIEPYFGDSSSLQWFISQVRELKDINRWNDRAALFFLKSKLRGSAQTFFQTSPSCKQVETFEEACQILCNFFGDKQAPASAIASFNSIVMLPNESLKNLAYRIEIAAHAAYNFIENDEALNKIKSIQLLNALPVALKTQLVFEDHADFNQLVEKASMIHDLTQSTAQINHIGSSSSSAHNDIADLKNQVEQLTDVVQTLISKCSICRGDHKVDDCPQLKSKQSDRLQRNVPMNSQVICQFCNRKGHIMPKCYRYLESIQCNNNRSNVRQNQNNQRPRQNTQGIRSRTFNNSNSLN